MQPTEDRILEAATEVAARAGYPHLTVARILTQARVSRATFYQYFSSADDCFWSAYRQHAERLLADVHAAAANSEDRTLAVLRTLVDTATSEPALARVLMTECLAAGPIGLGERDALIAGFEQAMTGSPGHVPQIDLPPAILIGGMFRFLTMYACDGSPSGQLRDQVLAWAGGFARPASETSWSARLAPALPLRTSESTAPRRKLRSAGTARDRIVRATALTIREMGYTQTTVADIVVAAGISRRRFYNEFASKSAAFIAAYEHGFQQTLAACTPAFFSAGDWPERIWQSAQAFTGYFASEPSLAYLGFVECYAVGPGFASRVHDTQLAYTLFLEEGYRQPREGPAPSRATSELTAAAIAEAGLQVTSRSPGLFIRRMQPLAVYIALSPFIGVDRAGDFVTGKLADQAAGSAAAA